MLLRIHHLFFVFLLVLLPMSFSFDYYIYCNPGTIFLPGEKINCYVNVYVKDHVENISLKVCLNGKFCKIYNRYEKYVEVENLLLYKFAVSYKIPNLHSGMYNFEIYLLLGGTKKKILQKVIYIAKIYKYFGWYGDDYILSLRILPSYIKTKIICYFGQNWTYIGKNYIKINFNEIFEELYKKKVNSIKCIVLDQYRDSRGILYEYSADISNIYPEISIKKSNDKYFIEIKRTGILDEVCILFNNSKTIHCGTGKVEIANMTGTIEIVGKLGDNKFILEEFNITPISLEKGNRRQYKEVEPLHFVINPYIIFIISIALLLLSLISFFMYKRAIEKKIEEFFIKPTEDIMKKVLGMPEEFVSEEEEKIGEVVPEKPPTLEDLLREIRSEKVTKETSREEGTAKEEEVKEESKEGEKKSGSEKIEGDNIKVLEIELDKTLGIKEDKK